MGVQGKTRDMLRQHRSLLAAEGMPLPPPGRSQGESTLKRQIPEGHDYDPRALKPLVKTLWALSVALGHVLTAHRQFSRLKSTSFSPDGLVGGRGYVMSVKDVRSLLFEASDHISSICDTIHDEINAPHWKPRLADLDEEDADDVVKLLDDASENLDDPEGEAEEDMDAIESRPKSKDPRFKVEIEQGNSNLPDGANEQPGHKPFIQDKQASGYSYERFANSSLPVSTLPGGPRVDHLDRGEQTGPGGSYNQDEPPVDDGWAEDLFHGKDHTVPRLGESVTPGAWSDDTPTEAWDFGLGFGAHGQGAGGYGTANPSSGGKGVNGPRSGLPDDPGGPTTPPGGDGTTEKVDQATHDKSLPGKGAQALLPNDMEKPVARADYYEGFKDNDIDKGAESALPGEENSPRNIDLDAPGSGYTYERQGPMVQWDDTTPQMKPDPIYERREGPK